MTTTTLGYRGIYQKVSSASFIKIPWKLVYVLLSSLSLVLLLFYIFRVNELTQGAYLIRSYNKEITSLSVENRNLQTHFAESGFLGQATQKAQELSFQKITQVKYVQILQNSLAEAK